MRSDPPIDRAWLVQRLLGADRRAPRVAGDVRVAAPGAQSTAAAGTDEAFALAAVPAAVLVPLIARERGVTVLLTQRATHLSRHAGQIAFPGGRHDPGDVSIVDTALREAHE